MSPSEWLERNKTSSWVTIRHIQLYLIICKKSYCGRVTHSLPWQKADTTTKKPLLRFGIVLPCVYISMLLTAGPWLCGGQFHPPPSDTRIVVDWTQFFLDRLPYRLTPSLLQKRVCRIKNLPEKEILSQLHLAPITFAAKKTILIK